MRIIDTFYRGRGFASSEQYGIIVHVADNNQYYRFSHSNVIVSGPETLVFECNENGTVTNLKEVAGGKGMSIAEATTDLKRVLGLSK